MKLKSLPGESHTPQYYERERDAGERETERERINLKLRGEF